MEPTTIIAVTFADGTVGRMQFYVKLSDSEIDTAVEKTNWHAGPAVSWRKVALEDFPADSAFRAAWNDTGSAIVVDMTVAREIQRNILRLRRKQLLAELDIDYSRADETGDISAKKSIAAEKQRLRDITDSPLLDAAATPEELVAVTLDKAVK